jgi:hypothetical protein
MSNSPQNQNLIEEFKAALESDDSEKNYTMIKAIINSLPAGALLGGFYESYVDSPATKRRDNFLEILVRELMELKSKIELVDFKSPVFLTILLHASQIATRTHKEQKLEALRNVVLNSSIPNSVDDDILAMFLNWIDGFTGLHISTLKHLHYLDSYAPNQLNTYFPNLDKYRAVYNQVLKDLADRGLITLTEKYITEEEEVDIYFQQPLMTPLGINFGTAYNQGKKKSGKEQKMIRRREDIDTLLKKNRSSSQASKTTELGKEFIVFIEFPSLQTESM